LRITWSARAASLTVAIGLGLAAVLFGWFYIRMHVLYGDFGASDHLLGYFGRASQGSVLDVMTRGHVWVHLYQRMTSTAPLSWAWPRYANLVAVVAVAGLVVAVVRVRPGVSRRAFAVCGLAVAVITMTVAQHVAGGGSLYPRYFFPVLGVVAALFAVAFDRLIPRLLPATLLAAMGWWAIRQMPIGVDPANTLRPRDEGDRPPVLLRTLPVGDGWRVVAAGLIGVGVIILVIAAAAIARWRRRGAVAGRTYPLTS